MTSTTTSAYEPSDAEVTAQILLAQRETLTDDDGNLARPSAGPFNRLTEDLAEAYNGYNDHGEGEHVVDLVISEHVRPITAATRLAMARALRAEKQLDGWELPEPVTFGRPLFAEMAAVMDLVPKPAQRVTERNKRLRAELDDCHDMVYGNEGGSRVEELLDMAGSDVLSVLRAVVARALRAEHALASEEFLAARLAQPTPQEVVAARSELGRGYWGSPEHRVLNVQLGADRVALEAAYEARYPQVRGQGYQAVQELELLVVRPILEATDAMVVRFLLAQNRAGGGDVDEQAEPSEAEVLAELLTLAWASTVDPRTISDNKTLWADVYDAANGEGGRVLVDRFVRNLTVESTVVLQAATVAALQAEAGQ